MIRMEEQMHLFSSILRLSLSILCGGILGIERGKANRSAGMRTYSLVCMSAALVMLTGEYMYEAFGTGDPARLGAQRQACGLPHVSAWRSGSVFMWEASWPQGRYILS